MRINRDKLKLAQARAMLGNKELAAAAKISANTLVTAGKVNVMPATVGKIAKALGVDVTEIIEDK
nr:MAG TPA: Methylphosphonate synthase, Hydroxymethylphosphonate, Iron, OXIDOREDUCTASE [Caudoviricetes sp.]